jgi:hypothetical protein
MIVHPWPGRPEADALVALERYAADIGLEAGAQS